jgi:hypothetical protein
MDVESYQDHWLRVHVGVCRRTKQEEGRGRREKTSGTPPSPPSSVVSAGDDIDRHRRLGKSAPPTFFFVDHRPNINYKFTFYSAATMIFARYAVALALCAATSTAFM